ncbi:MAG: hypothetical protein ACRYGP_30230 [Janthinobacterium lividum]
MDLDTVFQRAFEGFGSTEAPSGFPGFPGAERATGKDQITDIVEVSRVSRVSLSKTRATGSDTFPEAETISFAHGDACANVCPEKVPGNPGNPGKEGEVLADTDTYLFPKEIEKTGNPGKDGAPSAHPFLDLNSAKPQRSDWWTGDLMAEVDRADPPPGDPLPISPSDVRAGVARELRALAEDGREGPGALRDAIAITAAKIRNSEALAERQAHGGRCHICDEPLDDSAPVVAVLSWSRGGALHLHAACHDAYRARRTALIDRIMACAGYGETLTNGAAA